LREIEAAGQQEARRNEYIDARVRLHSLLGRKLWEVPVLDAASPEGGGYDYAGAHALHVALTRLARS
jgi:hypothetical protein